MSTRFTSKGFALVDSHSLQLIKSSSRLNDVMAKYISQGLAERQYESITPTLLTFLSTLECGVNFASEIARSLGVTRQMVAKTVKELCRLGYLEQKDGIGKQKEIHFTELGEQLMADARQLLSEVDAVLFEHLSDEQSVRLLNDIQEITGVIDDKLQGIKNNE